MDGTARTAGDATRATPQCTKSMSPRTNFTSQYIAQTYELQVFVLEIPKCCHHATTIPSVLPSVVSRTWFPNFTPVSFPAVTYARPGMTTSTRGTHLWTAVMGLFGPKAIPVVQSTALLHRNIQWQMKKRRDWRRKPIISVLHSTDRWLYHQWVTVTSLKCLHSTYNPSSIFRQSTENQTHYKKQNGQRLKKK